MSLPSSSLSSSSSLSAPSMAARSTAVVPSDFMTTKSSAASSSGRPAITAFSSLANTSSASNSLPHCATRVAASLYSALPLLRTGGVEQYLMLPPFQSERTSRAAASTSGTPPFLTRPRTAATFCRNSLAPLKRGILYSAIRVTLSHRSRISPTGATGSASFSTRTALRRATEPPVPSAAVEAKTTPGESSSLTILSRCTSCATLVTPAVPPTLATLARLRELMSEDLPTLGKPTIPTVMAVLMLRLRA
mmetsp:Transcript_54580/g.173408  ORF Transcript_54580/g.173408 Transcript_54580/m.173408 type:complete len:249 (+) Transcript_54580:325-1071(+)